MEMVEVFKTNVHEQLAAEHIITILQNLFPNCLINFDLDDCDRILRIQGTTIDTDYITQVMAQVGYVCEVLE